MKFVERVKGTKYDYYGGFNHQKIKYTKKYIKIQLYDIKSHHGKKQTRKKKEVSLTENKKKKN